MHDVIPGRNDLERRVEHISGRHLLLDVDAPPVELGEVLQVVEDGEAVVGDLADRVALQVEQAQ